MNVKLVEETELYIIDEDSAHIYIRAYNCIIRKPLILILILFFNIPANNGCKIVSLDKRKTNKNMKNIY